MESSLAPPEQGSSHRMGSRGDKVAGGSSHLLVSDSHSCFLLTPLASICKSCSRQETSRCFLFNETQFDYISTESPGGTDFSGGFQPACPL